MNSGISVGSFITKQICHPADYRKEVIMKGIVLIKRGSYMRVHVLFYDDIPSNDIINCHEYDSKVISR